MTTMGKGRGRPHGTGLNDEPVLAKMADLMVANPKLKPTTAFKRVEAEPHPSTIRRIQTKWKEHGQRLLKAARAKLDDAAFRARPQGDLSRMNKVEYAARGLPTGHSALGIYETMNSPAMHMALCTYNSPAMRTMREIYDRPVMKVARELYDTPTMRIIRDLQDTPIMRAMREMEAVKRALRGF